MGQAGSIPQLSSSSMRRRPAPISVKFYGIFWLFFFSFVFFVIYTPSEPSGPADLKPDSPFPAVPPESSKKSVDKPNTLTDSENSKTQISADKGPNVREQPTLPAIKVGVKDLLDKGPIPGPLSKPSLEDLWRQVRTITGSFKLPKGEWMDLVQQPQWNPYFGKIHLDIEDIWLTVNTFPR